MIALRDDIKANGLREPITTYDEQILDGRHRFRACEMANVEPRFEELPAGVNPFGFVISKNLHRRQLTTAQRAIVAARIANLGEGRPEKTAGIPAVSQADAARQLGTSRDAVQQATQLLKAGSDEVIEAAMAGQISLHAAVTISERPKRVQPREVERHIARARCKAHRPRKKPVAPKPTPHDEAPALTSPPAFKTFAVRLDELVADELQYIDSHELVSVSEWTPGERTEAVRRLSVLREHIDKLIAAVNGGVA